MGIVTFPSEAEWVQGEAEKPSSHCGQHSTTSKQLEGGMRGHSDTLSGSRCPRRGWHAAGYRGRGPTDTFEPVSGPWKTSLLVGLSPGLGQEHWGGEGHSCPHRAPTVSYCLTGPGACIPRLLE